MVGRRRAGWIAAIRKGKRQNWSWDATTRPSGLVMELHIDPEFQGRGVGRRLLETAEQHFRSTGSDWVSLGVFPTNGEARRFYERLGYRPVYAFLGKRLPPS